VSRPAMRWLAAGCAVAVCSANALLLWKTFVDLGGIDSLVGGIFGGVCVAGSGFLLWVLLVPLRIARPQEAETPARPLILA